MSEKTEDAVDSVRSGASTLRSSRVFQTLARGGYAVNGLIHMLIGAIALTVAFGGQGEADQGGALAQVASYPFGEVILWVVVVALAALGLFQFVDAALVRGREKSDWADRAKEAGKGIAYLAVGASALTYAMGGSSDSGNQTQGLSASLLATPGGVVLLVVVGVATMAIGGYFVVKGIRRKFLDDLALPNARWKRSATVLGVAGYVSKGVAIFVVGVLFVVAAATADASEASGLDGALKSLAALPAGGALLVAIGIGLIAYGVYCFVRARFRA
ncbi:DUF1206 domain-containing protein [Conyzicola nivalis]|uniref:DUF1206 domain-containing protein n=1 Tax=Conyzicola nivalis TaxID=1477021 RepID=A0A916SIV2_9MICO|nr:DUF1206 domain-containing protein [Conyzicola nivalis]GGB01636.1 hypothetical protein GCM10010979_15250 [Conyzicola nivalis]